MKTENINLANYLSELCMDLGLNTAIDYDGVEDDSDVEIYKKAVQRKIHELLKSDFRLNHVKQSKSEIDLNCEVKVKIKKLGKLKSLTISL